MLRDKNTELSSGLCRISLSVDSDELNWTSIPPGPFGTVGRWLLRTPKFNSAGGVGSYPSIRDLRVTHYIPNNLDVQYTDTNGDDLSLRDRPDIVRFDRIMQPPARYIGNFDGRNIVGYTKPHPGAIILSPPVLRTTIGPNYVGLDDDHAQLVAFDTKVFEFDVGVGTAGKLTLYKEGVTDAASTFDVSSATRIQQLVDRINAMTGLEAAGAWRAQLVFGADGSATADNLAVTTGINTGDTAGRVRSFSTSYPAIAYFKTTYLSNFSTNKARWFFTQGGPDVPTNLADAYLAGNYRTGLSSWGILMGFAPLLDGCLIFFSKAIVLFRNTKSGRSGLDEDYHPADLFTSLGCIAWDSITWGDGWAGCLTEQGYFIFDGMRGGLLNISADVWNPATQTGEWAYEIAQCAAATAADNDGAHFHAKVMGSKLYVTYRSDSGAASGIPNRMMVYDFSLSASGSGLSEMLRPDGSPWGWSSPMGLTLSVMGEVRKSTGTARYGCIESNAGTTNGRVDQFETGTTDNGTAIAGDLWGPIDYAESLDKKSAQEARLVYKVNGSGVKFHFRRTDGVTTVVETGSGLVIPTTGSSGTFARVVIPLPQTARSQALGHQIRLSDDGAGGAMEVWGMELDEIMGSGY